MDDPKTLKKRKRDPEKEKEKPKPKPQKKLRFFVVRDIDVLGGKTYGVIAAADEEFAAKYAHEELEAFGKEVTTKDLIEIEFADEAEYFWVCPDLQ